MGITMFLDTWASPPYQGKTHKMEERGEKEKKKSTPVCPLIAIRDLCHLVMSHSQA